MKKYGKRKITKRKRTYKRNNKKNYKKNYNSRSIGSWYPFGLTQIGKLRYCENISVDPGAGVAGTYTYSANGLYDPNISGTGA